MYWPTTPPDSSNVSSWTMGELITLARLLNDGQPMLILPPQYAAPDRPRAGMVVNADGTTWNPGGGAGLYQYLSGSWTKL
jgi:hypothetical protein